MALKSRVLNTALTIIFIACRVVGMAGKLRGVSTVAKSITPQTGKIAHFSGYTGTKSRLTNVLEWGFELYKNDMGYCGYNPRTNRHFYIFVFMLRNAEIFKLQEVLQ